MKINQHFFLLVVVWGLLAMGQAVSKPVGTDFISNRSSLTSRPAGAVISATPLPDTVAIAGKQFFYEIPSATFTNEDPDALVYSAQLTDGSPLPSWLTFDNAGTTATFSGIPANFHHGILEVEVTASNASGSSATDVFEIEVQAIPEVDLNGFFAAGRNYATFMEEDGPDSIAITDPGVFVRDNDGNVITKALISLSEIELYNPAEEYLLVTDEAIAAANAAGLPVPVFNPVSGDIEIVGDASLAEYAAVFREIVYVNISEDVIGGSRTIVFLVTDEDENEGNVAICTITIIPDNDSPTIDLDISDADPNSSYVTTYTEDTPPVPIADDNIALEDIDYHDNGSVTITLVNRPDTLQETLRVIGSLPAGITASYNEVTGTIELSGSASLDDYEDAIQQVGYHNASQDPDLTPRIVSIVFDDGDGGESTSRATTRVNIIPVNDPPDSRGDTIIVGEYSRDNIIQATLPTDIDNELSELSMTVVSLPTLGFVTYADGTPLEVGDLLDSAQFADLQYDTPDNYDGVSAPGTLVYNVSDGEFSVPSTVTFIINNAPEAEDFTATTDEDVPYVFTLNDFAAGYSDVEGDSMTHVVVSSLPAQGLLLLEGDTVQLDDRIRISALDSGKLVFIPTLNGNGSPYSSFLFRAQDERLAVSGLYVAIVNVTPVSDPPAVDTVRVSGEENEPLFFTADDFIAQFSDPEGDTLTVVKIGSLPPKGRLVFNNQLVQVGDEIAVDSLHLLSFEPNFGFDGTVQFRWNGYDGSAYADDSAPVIISILEDNRISALNDTIRLVDVTVYEGSLIEQVVNPTGGDFTFTSTPVVTTQHGTLIIRTDGTYTYQTTEDFSGTDAFTFEVCNTNTPVQCAQATVTIIVPPPLQVYGGFSPDNDGTNDVWNIRGITNYPNNHVRVFNRWGNVVFEVAGYNNEDRAWKSESIEVPDGTYFYLIDLGNNQPPRSGYVIVNR